MGVIPKRVKFRKAHRGRMRGKAMRGADISFGEYGLKALEPAWVTDRQIEIIYHILEGSSNQEIADRLGIKKKTIETHVLHIYNKLGINNKMELMHIGLEYNLVLRKNVL